jgi:hypothetical protein
LVRCRRSTCTQGAANKEAANLPRIARPPARREPPEIAALLKRWRDRGLIGEHATDIPSVLDVATARTEFLFGLAYTTSAWAELVKACSLLAIKHLDHRWELERDEAVLIDRWENDEEH